MRPLYPSGLMWCGMAGEAVTISPFTFTLMVDGSAKQGLTPADDVTVELVIAPVVMRLKAVVCLLSESVERQGHLVHCEALVPLELVAI